MADLKQRLQDDLKSAMLAGDRFVADVLKGVKSAILYEEIAQNKREAGLSETAIEELLMREVKKRNDSIAMYDKGGNQELADKERAEIRIIEQYLPKQMDEDEVRDIVERTVKELNAKNPQDMGQVIGKVRSEIGTRANGAVVARIVKETLSNK